MTPFISKYQVCSVQILCGYSTQKEKNWMKLRQVDKILDINDKIVAYLSCIIAVQEIVPKKTEARAYRERDPSSEANEDDKEIAAIGNTLCGVAFCLVVD